MKRSISYTRLGFIVMVQLVIVFSLFGQFVLASVASTNDVKEDADWIMGAVITSGPMAGAIASYPDQQHIRPYMASHAAIGLARASQVTGDNTYINAAWNYLDWYASHMDGSNYVHDYDLISGSWAVAPNSQSSSAYDSTDAYAGMFIQATKVAYLVDPSSSHLASLHPALIKAVAAAKSTQQSDGLTWATPTYQVKYLQDNCETYAGLSSASALASILDDSSLQQNAATAAASIKTGMASLWDNTAQSYDWAKHANGTIQTTDWNVLSPDVMQQACMVSYGLVDSTRANILLNQIDTNQPNWYKPAMNANYYDIAFFGWGYKLNGNSAKADTAATNIRSAAVTASRAWPYNVMAAGELLILETDGENLIIGQPQPASTSTTSGTTNNAGGSSAAKKPNTTNPAVSKPAAASTTTQNTQASSGNPNDQQAKVVQATSPKMSSTHHSVYTYLFWACGVGLIIDLLVLAYELLKTFKTGHLRFHFIHLHHH